MTAHAPALQCTGLTKTFNAGLPESRPALDGIDLTLQAGDFLVVIGGNGAGKSTLLNLIAGSISPDSGRILLGGYAGNIGGSGLELTASDSLFDQPTGRYHSQYISLGRQIGRSVYASGDYSTSLSVIRFSRSDGIIVETRPHTSRFSGTASINVGRSIALLTTVERTSDDQSHDLRLLSGITYRTR